MFEKMHSEKPLPLLSSGGLHILQTGLNFRMYFHYEAVAPKKIVLNCRNLIRVNVQLQHQNIVFIFIHEINEIVSNFLSSLCRLHFLHRISQPLLLSKRSRPSN